MSVTQIGGFFVKCPDPAELRSWYRRHLGLHFSDGGAARFSWHEADTGDAACTLLGFFDESTAYFDPGTQPFMVNYRVRDLGALVEALREDGERVFVDETPRPEGRFAWVVDPDGQKAELWEPSEGMADAPPVRVEHGRVQAIGGVFFRSGDPAALKKWYAKLGVIPRPDGYVIFPAKSADSPASPGETDAAGGKPERPAEAAASLRDTYTVWDIFPSDTTYLDSDGERSPHDFMLNLRVKDLDGLISDLRAGGVWVDPKREEYDEFGKFGWITDPMGARIELWEAPDG